MAKQGRYIHFSIKKSTVPGKHPGGSLPCRQTGSLRLEWQGILRNETTKDGHQSMAMNIFEKRRKLIQQRYKKKFKFIMQNLREINMEKTGIRITKDIPIMK